MAQVFGLSGAFLLIWSLWISWMFNFSRSLFFSMVLLSVLSF